MCLRGRRNDTTIIPLEYAVAQRGHGSSGGGQFTFIVYHADDRSGSYHFSQFLSCSTEEDRDEWMHALGSCSTRELHTDREETAASALRAAEEMEAVHVQLAAEQEQKKRIVEMLEAQVELGRALTVRHELLMVVTEAYRQLHRSFDSQFPGFTCFERRRLSLSLSLSRVQTYRRCTYHANSCVVIVSLFVCVVPCFFFAALFLFSSSSRGLPGCCT